MSLICLLILISDQAPPGENPVEVVVDADVHTEETRAASAVESVGRILHQIRIELVRTKDARLPDHVDQRRTARVHIVPPDPDQDDGVFPPEATPGTSGLLLNGTGNNMAASYDSDDDGNAGGFFDEDDDDDWTPRPETKKKQPKSPKRRRGRPPKKIRDKDFETDLTFAVKIAPKRKPTLPGRIGNIQVQELDDKTKTTIFGEDNDALEVETNEEAEEFAVSYLDPDAEEIKMGLNTMFTQDDIKEKDLKRKKQYKCDDCGRAFPRPCLLIAHQRQHDTEFKCPECSETFTGEPDLRKHMASHDETGKKFPCAQCGVEFKKTFARYLHVRSRHAGQRKYSCVVCNEVCLGRAALKNHRAQVHGDGFECDVCHKVYDKAAAFKIHMSSHMNLKQYKCKLCDKGYNTRAMLRYHEKYYHNPETGGLKPRDKVCHNCGKAFRRQDNLTVHLGSCLNLRKFECGLCDRTFNTRTSLGLHLAEHDPERPQFTCEYCGRVFKWASNLRDHRKIHMDLKQYECKECGKGFNTSSARNMHMTTHKTTRDHFCEICGKTFKWPHALRDHRLTHSDQKHYQCAVCGKEFHTSSMLSSHKNYCSKQGLECPICHEVIIGGKRMLQQHRKKHRIEPTCEECGKSFARRESLRRHMEIHRNQRGYSCDFCGKAFNTSSQLYMHRSRVHKIPFAPVSTLDELFVSVPPEGVVGHY